MPIKFDVWVNDDLDPFTALIGQITQQFPGLMKESKVDGFLKCAEGGLAIS